MPTQKFKFYGTCNYAKVHEPDQKFNIYTLDAYLDDPSWRLFTRSGMQLQIRENEETGAEFVKFRRPVEGIIDKKLIEYGPVPVEDADGNKITDLIGNGSTCIFEVAVFDTRKGKGHRLEKLVVTNLIPYAGKAIDAHDFQEDEEEVAEPAPTKVTSGKLAKTAPVNRKGRNVEVEDDDIPF